MSSDSILNGYHPRTFPLKFGPSLHVVLEEMIFNDIFAEFSIFSSGTILVGGSSFQNEMPFISTSLAFEMLKF